MTPAYAWAPSGKRAFDVKPAQRGGNISMVGALKNSGMQALYPYDGAVDGERFIDFIEHKLMPHLSDGDVIIMDNCRTHYAKIVTDRLEALSIRGFHLGDLCRSFFCLNMSLPSAHEQMSSMPIIGNNQTRPS